MPYEQLHRQNQKDLKANEYLVFLTRIFFNRHHIKGKY